MKKRIFKRTKVVKNIFPQDINKPSALKTGMAPGTLVFTGIRKIDQATINVVEFNSDNVEQCLILDGDIEKIKLGDKMTWIDCVGLHDVGLVKSLGDKFDIGHLLLEDILSVGQMPKYVMADKGNFLTFQTFILDKDVTELYKEQTSIYFNGEVVITFREDTRFSFEPIYSRLDNPESRILRNGIDYLVYTLLDLIVDNYLETARYFEGEIEKYEMLIEDRPDSELKKEIFYFRRSFLYFFKMIGPMEETIIRFRSADGEVLTSETKIYLSDLVDHCKRLRNIAETYNEMIYMLYDLLHTEINYRSNTIIKTLTVISAIFIPLTFIVGVYGMNFKYMPELDWSYGYYLIWGVMVVFSILAMIYFRNKRWI